MESLLTQIEKGIDANLYYLSLFISLSIPDICAALESSDGKTSGTKYKKWVNNYLVSIKPSMYGERLSADHIWLFRCALLHQGRTTKDGIEYQRILFFEPGIETGLHVASCCIVGAKTKDKSLLIDINKFCTDIISAARLWVKENEANPNYQKNYERLIKRYPKGVSPVFGVPIIG